MKKLGIEALYRRPRTPKPAPGHKVYPYLLRNMDITRPNQVWAMDITYVPMAHGFVYLAAVVDWFSRRSSPGGCRLDTEIRAERDRWRRRSPGAYASVTEARASTGRYCLLQWPKAAFIAWRANARPGIPHPAAADSGRSITARASTQRQPGSCSDRPSHLYDRLA